MQNKSTGSNNTFIKPLPWDLITVIDTVFDCSLFLIIGSGCHLIEVYRYRIYCKHGEHLHIFVTEKSI